MRRAIPADAVRVGELYLRARRAAVPAVPNSVHSDDETREWIRDVVIPARETWLAEQRGVLLAMLALDDEGIDQLYVDPGRTGRGVGAALLRLAKRRRPEGLLLWTFEANSGARRFYERHGFTAVEHTDGSGNEERTPDVRYAWSNR